MSTLKVTNIQATGETASRAVSGVAAAWVNFNGTGTIATRDSQNVSSLTDNSTGDYTVNYSSNFSIANYSFTHNGICSIGSRGGAFSGTRVSSLSNPDLSNNYNVSSHRFQTAYASDAASNGGVSEPDTICMQINGDLA
jgi:phage FluMu protein gp41